jgi:tryptophan synthase alpha chain
VNRLDRAFTGKRKPLIAYLCVGDPTVDESVDLALACIRAGADILELGVPYSDPAADGPVIARAGARAIAAGGGLEATLRVARSIRAAQPDVGLLLFGYYNPIYIRGELRTAADAAEAGIDALLIVDLPAEEGAELRAAAAARGLGIVPLLTPTSSPARVAAAREAATRAPAPFVYYVSVMGITGTTALNASGAGARAGALRAEMGRPVVVGFGVDSRAKARDTARQADGVVVGTALVRVIEQGATAPERLAAAERLIRDLRAGMDEAQAG